MAEHAKNETQSPAERTVALLKAQGRPLPAPSPVPAA